MVKNTKKTINKRETLYDFLKVYAMLSVVLDHTLTKFIPNIQSTQLYNFIFLTQMPLFIVISGILFYPKIESGIKWENIRKIIRSFFVPFFTFTILLSLLNGQILEIPYNIYQSIIKPELSLWFLFVLAIIEILMAFSINLVGKYKYKNEYIKLLCIIVTYIGMCIPIAIVYLYGDKTIFDVKLILYYSIFFIYGLIVAMLIKKLTNKYVISLVFVASVFTLVYVMVKHPAIIFENETIANLIARIVGSVAAINIFVIIGKKIQSNPAIKKISAAGKYSLELYYVHLLLIKSRVFDFTINNMNISIFIAIYLTIIIISFIIIQLIKQSKVLDLIIFGKYNQKLQQKDNKIA